MGHVIDLRSDTLTKPTDEMRRAMTSAEVGDDVYGEDPTVARLEERVAGMLGHEAALFTPTGSMANVLAVRSLVGPGQEVLCEASAHIARAELGAHGAYTGLTMRTWIHPRGQVDLDAIRTIFAPDMGRSSCRPPRSPSRTPTTSPGSGVAAAGPSRPARVRHRRRCRRARRRRPHLERARRHRHAAGRVRRGRRRAVRVPVQGPGGAGRVAGGRQQRHDRRGPVWRKRMGGGMRQVGILAAAGLHALDHHVERLAEDHAHARLLAEACGVDPAAVDTNIVVVQRADAPGFVAAARAEGVLVSAVGPTTVRLVTHLDVSREDAERAAAVLAPLAAAHQ